MSTTTKEAFKIMGIAVRTSNNNGEAAKDIPALWGRFLSENKIAEIPGKTDGTIYCVYTNYEGDYTQPYTTLLGCRVSSLESIPAVFTALEIEASNYEVFTAKGKIMEGMVFKEWEKIWNSDLNRAYAADFEVYGEKSQNPDDAEVDIFIGIN